jgi:hypothetical protein
MQRPPARWSIDSVQERYIARVTKQLGSTLRLPASIEPQASSRKHRAASIERTDCAA